MFPEKFFKRLRLAMKGTINFNVALFNRIVNYHQTRNAAKCIAQFLSFACATLW